MIMRLAMYNVTFNLDDELPSIVMRVPQDQVDGFIRILMLNGIKSFSAKVEEQSNARAN